MNDHHSAEVVSHDTFRARLYRELVGGLAGDGRLSRTNKALIALILASIAFVIVDSESSVAGQFAGPFQLIEMTFGIVFLVEYLARLWASAEDPRFGGGIRGIVRFALTPPALFDLVALSPLFFGAIGSEAYVLRLLRLLRILRLTKIGRYSAAASAISRAISLRRYELGVSLGIGLLLMLVAAACLYALEGADQPEKFGSIPRAMWWSISMLTVGYGDVYPITLLGRVFASFVAVIGIGLIAVPTGIITASLTEVLTKPANDKIGEAERITLNPTAFSAAITTLLARAQKQGRPHVEINAGELHRQLGGYPGPNHRMPSCCASLRAVISGRDVVVFEPAQGDGASLTVRFALPR
ncbi:MAG: potassium channel protein [Devosia sp.]|uniref:potassium channel family protein n=1 Tax=Devosia sp. TaxID=1871048 RepID=UPI0026159702|nr:potassium channel family protein [Devosia sp.]MDB5542176.1 potassium channel protein [Devosia sp.]